jgi:hypothetical protein
LMPTSKGKRRSEMTLIVTTVIVARHNIQHGIFCGDSFCLLFAIRKMAWCLLFFVCRYLICQVEKAVGNVASFQGMWNVNAYRHSFLESDTNLETFWWDKSPNNFDSFARKSTNGWLMVTIQSSSWLLVFKTSASPSRAHILYRCSPDRLSNSSCHQ